MEDNDSDSDTGSDTGKLAIKTVKFRSRTIQAPAARIYSNRHVYLLHIPTNPIPARLLLWMPQFVHSWLQWILPEWFLPSNVILKERNSQKADEFDNEIATYRKLKPLQGYCIPVMYGKVASCKTTCFHIHDGPTPAILLQHITGVPLHQLAIDQLESPKLLEELEGIFTSFTENGIVHGDPLLHTFLCDEDGRIFAIDFEFSHLPIDITNGHEFEGLKEGIKELVRIRSEENIAALGSE